MAKKIVAIGMLLAVLASGCSTPTQAGPIAGPSDRDATDAETERAMVDPIEPTVEPAPTNEPAETPATSPAEPTSEAAAGESDDTDLIISPEGPLPSRWLCTLNVEDSEELNLRSGPSLDAAIVFGIPGGTCRMRALGAESDGWVKVVYETQNISIVGHVSTEFAAEDAERTIALAWFERVVAEQDTSGIADQPSIDEWIAFHPFPAAAYRVVPFAVGRSSDCEPMDFGVTGCPVHVLDSAGELVTPMVIQTQLVPVDGGVSEVMVTGFDLCFGTEDCAVVDFSLHGRIVVDETGSLAGVAIGTGAEEAIAALTSALGEPTTDTGWIVGCPFDGAGSSDENERYLEWGSLRAGFQNFDQGPEAAKFHHWVFDEFRGVNLQGPQRWEVRLPDGAAMGMNITVAAANTSADLFVNEVIQVQHLRTGSWSFWGEGIETDTRIGTVGVPFIPICD